MKNHALPKDWEYLVRTARDVRTRAWVPYSGFAVGAAVRDASGEVFAGCNVENASYGLSICAERTAMSAAVAAGCVRPEVICVSLAGQPLPCGSCRQFLFEFHPGMLVLLDRTDSPDPPECVVLEELLPRAFRLDPGAADENASGSC